MKNNGKFAIPLANAKEIEVFNIKGVEGIKELYGDNAGVVLQRLVDSNLLSEGNY